MTFITPSTRNSGFFTGDGVYKVPIVVPYKVPIVVAFKVLNSKMESRKNILNTDLAPKVLITTDWFKNGVPIRS